MHLKIILFLTYLFPMLSLAQAPEIAWKVIVDDIEPILNIFSKEVYAVDKDGNIYIGGDAVFEDGEVDIIIYKFNSEGLFLWKQIIGEFNTRDILINLSINNQGELYAIGHSDSCAGLDVDEDICLGEFEAWIKLINTEGELINTRVFSGSADDYMFRSGIGEDGSILVSGGTNSKDGFFSENKDSSAMFIAKFDSELALQWIRYTEALIIDVVVSNDFVFACAEKRIEVEGDDTLVDLWVYKIRAKDGNLVFTEKIEGDGRDLNSKILVNNSNIYVGLRSTSTNNIYTDQKGESDYFLIKLDLDGNIIWAKNYGGRGVDSFETISFDFSRENIFLCGEVFSDDGDIPEKTQLVNTWLVKVDAENGDIVWSKIYDIESGDSQPNHFMSPTGEIIILSDIFLSETVPEHSIILAKLEQEKNVESISNFDFVIAPNPMQLGASSFRIFSDSLFRRDFSIQITDVVGHILWSSSDLFFASNPMEISMPLFSSPGMYYIHLSTQDINVSKPLVIID